MHLSLLLPQLVWPEPEDGAALERLPCPDLEWLCSRASFHRHQSRPYEYALASAFGLDERAPFGVLRLLGEAIETPTADPNEGFWLCADPVHLRFHHERIILADAGAFDLSETEVFALIEGLNREFPDIGRFHVADSRRWYVRLNSDAPFRAAPLSAVAGRRMEGELPDEVQASRVRSWLNEVQMFLHGHPVNAARATAGKPAVNSLWLWGAGSMPERRDTNLYSVWSNDPLARGLARSCGVPVHCAPPDLDMLLSHAAPDGYHLVVLDQLLAPVLYEDSKNWRDALLQLEKSWFTPLRAMIGRKIGRATLIAPTVYGELTWEVKGSARWQFWRRPQSLASLAKELAQ